MRKTGHLFPFLLVSLAETLLRSSGVIAIGPPISTEPVDSECSVNGCSLLANISVLRHRNVSLFCTLTTKDNSIKGNNLQVVLMDTDTEFVLGESNCHWRISEGDEYLHCDLVLRQNFTKVGARHLLYFTTPGDIYERFTVNVLSGDDVADQAELCEALGDYPTSLVPVEDTINLYQDVKNTNGGPSLLGKLAVATIAFVALLFCVLGVRWYYKSKQEDEGSNPKDGEGDRMIVYKTQPTWCQEPDTDSDVNELEPFYCNDSDE